VLKRSRDKQQAKQARQQRREAAAAALAAMEASGFMQPFDPTAFASSTTTPTEAPAGSSSRGAATAVPAAAATGRAVGPSLPVALLFPGQGSQAVGMISAAAAEQPAVAAMLAEARDVLGYDLLALIRDGEWNMLDDTLNDKMACYWCTACCC
jgi:[acyl-carrier-protein] S-malonyltransferase